MTNYTREQLAILGAAQNTNENIVVEALAGSGKTSTLMALLPKLKGTIGLQAFNKSIAEELKAKTRTLPLSTASRLTIGTSHSFGLRALRPHMRKDTKVTSGKLAFILKDMFPGTQYDPIEKVAHLIRRLVSSAKNSGFGLGEQRFAFINTSETFADEGDEDNWLQLAEHFGYDLEFESIDCGISYNQFISISQRLLAASNANLSMIDFDDMIYLPLLLCKSVPVYDNLLIDEAQDISSTRRALAFRSITPDGRVIAVGDKNQAIYGFTGADTMSLDNIRVSSHAHTYPLTICWRCDDEILNQARRIVPEIRTRPNAPSGTVESISMYDLVDNYNQVADEPAKAENLLLPAPGDAILCRLNKPLVATALELIKNGQRVRIEGRDIGGKLLELCKTADSAWRFNKLSTIADNVETWGDAQVQKLLVTNRESQAAYLQDELDALGILIQRCIVQHSADAKFSQLETMVTNLFDDNIPASQFITLSTVHKSKGREWKRVWALGRSDYMPFHRATKPWELVQERNLIYVMVTRAEQELIYITDVMSWVDSKKKDI